jgi:hypothetical protein
MPLSLLEDEPDDTTYRQLEINLAAVIHGTREAIAQVGAWMVGTRRPVPADLRVDIPDLEAALLTLLDDDHTDQMGAAS